MSKIKSLIKIELFKKTKQHLTGTLFVPRMGFEIRRVQRCFFGRCMDMVTLLELTYPLPVGTLEDDYPFPSLNIFPEITLHISI